jgi:hypothetical protein
MADTIASVVVQLAADMGDAIAGLRDAAAAFLGLGRAMEDTAQAGYVFGRAAQAVFDEQKRLDDEVAAEPRLLPMFMEIILLVPQTLRALRREARRLAA